MLRHRALASWLAVLAFGCSTSKDDAGTGITTNDAVTGSDEADTDTDTDSDTDDAPIGAHGDQEPGTATTVVYGAGEYENAGAAVLWMDLDGDQDDDLVALADQSTDPAQGPPYVAVWDTFPRGETSFLDSAWTINNELPSIDSRIRWMGTGDLSGDGIPDLLVERTLPYAGAETVLLPGPLSSTRSLGQLSAQVVFESDAEVLHWAAIPDVTGDGVEDLMAGNPNLSEIAEDAGHAWIFAGPLEGRREEDLAFARFEGDQAREGIGSAVAAADANGDGVGDVVLAAITEHVYVLYGPVGGISSVQLGYDARWTYDAADTIQTSVYTSPVWVGDATGDGHADMLFGSQDLRLVEGPLSGELSEDDVAATLPGATDFSVGDANRDGAPDLLVGDGEYNPGVSADEGVAFLYYGPMTGGIGASDAVFHGTLAQDRLGSAVSLGDGDGDGFDDAAIGAPGYDGGGVEAGAVLIFTGGL
jgi:hypothetical protein